MNRALVPLASAFGLIVREFRQKSGWTQEELAEKAGVHRTYVGDLENGRKAPTLDVVERLADAFDTAPHLLIEAAEKLRR